MFSNGFMRLTCSAIVMLEYSAGHDEIFREIRTRKNQATQAWKR
jgi:hypothetical protein